MTLALVVVTLASLAMVAALLVLVWRLLREERRRSAARVAALEEGIRGVSSDAPAEPAPVDRAPRVAPTPMVAPSPVRAAVAPSIAPRMVAADSRAPLRPMPIDEDPLSRPIDAGRFDADEGSSARSDLFGTTVRPARGSRNFGLIAAVGMLVVGAAVAFATMSGGKKPPPSPASADRHATTTVAATSTPPLELVSLRHRRDGDALSITGMVRNPASGARVQHLTAVVFLFDRNGGFLASGRAAIDYTALVPGDESPFVVTVKEPGAVGRYRVSFRTDERVVPHVDRREDIAVARSVS